MSYDNFDTRENVYPSWLDPSNRESWAILNLGQPPTLDGIIVPGNKQTILAPYLILVGLIATVSTIYTFKKRRN